MKYLLKTVELSLEANAVENLHDFEEEAVDDIFRNKKDIPECLQNKPEAEQRLLKISELN